MQAVKNLRKLTHLVHWSSLCLCIEGDEFWVKMRMKLTLFWWVERLGPEITRVMYICTWVCWESKPLPGYVESRNHYQGMLRVETTTRVCWESKPLPGYVESRNHYQGMLRVETTTRVCWELFTLQINFVPSCPIIVDSIRSEEKHGDASVRWYCCRQWL
jgi:hypothetical protein